MAIASRQKPHGGGGELKLFRLCPFWQTGNSSNNNDNSSSNNNNNHSSSSSSSTQYLTHSHNGTNSSGIITSNRRGDANNKNASRAPTTVSSVARSLLPARRRLRLDPPNHLFFPYEPGKQVRSAIRLKNTSKSHVAFKFQTTAPKSCYMRPPGGILAPGESLIATVFKFVEQPENNEKPMDQKSKVKFKIMSLKVKGGGIDYVPELDLVDEITRMQGIALQPSSFGSVIPDSKFDEQRDQVTVERILRVVFLDVERPSTALEKLSRQLAEAEAALEARKKPPPETGPRAIGEGFVIDEWKERREKYLARQQVEAVDSA